MPGLPAADSSLATDRDRTYHDRIFKELLTTFFIEFLQLFYPKLAKTLDPNSIEFLSQELFVNFPDGDTYTADILAKARLKGDEAFFIIHVEHQSTAPASFPQRFFRYYSAIFHKYGCPVYPIVIYSHDRPLKAQPNVYRVNFPDGEVLRFRYRVVQLNRLNWRSFVKRHNPVASALMAKMKIAERDRPRVKAECLRLMVTLKLDRAKMRLIAEFVDTYLNLNAAEEQRFNLTLDSMKLRPAEKGEIVEIVTSWERKGIEKGLVEGRAEGEAEGLIKGRREALEAFREVLLDAIASRFGSPDESIRARVLNMDSIEVLRAAARRTFTAGSIEEIGL